MSEDKERVNKAITDCLTVFVENRLDTDEAHTAILTLYKLNERAKEEIETRLNKKADS